MPTSQYELARRALIVGGLVAASYTEGWASPVSFFAVNLVGFAFIAWQPGLLILIPGFIFTQSLGYASVSSWLGWSENIGDTGIVLLVGPLLATMLFERGDLQTPWHQRPLHRPAILGMASLSILAWAIALGDRTTQGSHLAIYFWPFLVLCAVQAFRPLQTASGGTRRDPLGKQRHWFLTLLVATVLSGYLLYASFGDWSAWRYYAQLHVFPVALVAFIIFRAFSPPPIAIPGTLPIGSDDRRGISQEADVDEVH